MVYDDGVEEWTKFCWYVVTATSVDVPEPSAAVHK